MVSSLLGVAYFLASWSNAMYGNCQMLLRFLAAQFHCLPFLLPLVQYDGCLTLNILANVLLASGTSYPLSVLGFLP